MTKTSTRREQILRIGGKAKKVEPCAGVTFNDVPEEKNTPTSSSRWESPLPLLRGRAGLPCRRKGRWRNGAETSMQGRGMEFISRGLLLNVRN